MQEQISLWGSDFLVHGLDFLLFLTHGSEGRLVEGGDTQTQGKATNGKLTSRYK